ncbi:MAG TPA: cache domain-containing protein, partial [Myxococcaceae bacterium]
MKLYIAMGVVTLPLLLLHPFYVLPTVRSQLHQDRIRTMQQVVETAYGVLVSYEDRVRKGELTTAQAQSEAARLLQGLRYGENEYFWVNDLEPRLVMHPHLPKMVGTSMKDYRDSHGNAVFVEIAELARQQGEGNLEYYATRPGETAPLLKQSYVKLFAPWGWVVGTGIY